MVYNFNTAPAPPVSIGGDLAVKNHNKMKTIELLRQPAPLIAMLCAAAMIVCGIIYAINHPYLF